MSKFFIALAVTLAALRYAECFEPKDGSCNNNYGNEKTLGCENDYIASVRFDELCNDGTFTAVTGTGNDRAGCLYRKACFCKDRCRPCKTCKPAPPKCPEPPKEEPPKCPCQTCEQPKPDCGCGCKK